MRASTKIIHQNSMILVNISQKEGSGENVFVILKLLKLKFLVNRKQNDWRSEISLKIKKVYLYIFVLSSSKRCKFFEYSLLNFMVILTTISIL